MIKRSQLLRRKTVFSVPLHSETSQRCCLHTLSLPPCLWFSLWPTLHLVSASLVHRSCSWQVYCSLHVAKWNDQWSFLCPRPIWLLSTSPPGWPLIIRTSSSGICNTTFSWFSSWFAGCSFLSHAMVSSGYCILGPLPFSISTFLMWSHTSKALNVIGTEVSQMFILWISSLLWALDTDTTASSTLPLRYTKWHSKWCSNRRFFILYSNQVLPQLSQEIASPSIQ